MSEGWKEEADEFKWVVEGAGWTGLKEEDGSLGITDGEGARGVERGRDEGPAVIAG